LCAAQARRSFSEGSHLPKPRGPEANDHSRPRHRSRLAGLASPDVSDGGTDPVWRCPRRRGWKTDTRPEFVEETRWGFPAFWAFSRELSAARLRWHAGLPAPFSPPGALP